MVTVTAHLKVQPKRVDDFIPLIKKLALKSWTEKGCLKYDHFRLEKPPNEFMIFEQWSTMEDYLNHANGQPVKDFKNVVTPFFQEPIKAPKWTKIMEK